MPIHLLFRRAVRATWFLAFVAIASFQAASAATPDASRDFWRNIQARALPADAP